MRRKYPERLDTDGIKYAQPPPDSLLLHSSSQEIRGTVEVVWRYMGMKRLYIFMGGEYNIYSGWAWPTTPLFGRVASGGGIGLGGV